jgi:hypothetical protein
VGDLLTNKRGKMMRYEVDYDHWEMHNFIDDEPRYGPLIPRFGYHVYYSKEDFAETGKGFYVEVWEREGPGFHKTCLHEAGYSAWAAARSWVVEYLVSKQ